MPKYVQRSFLAGIGESGYTTLSLAVGFFGKPENAAYYPVKLKTGVAGSDTLLLGYKDFSGVIFCSKIKQSSNTCEIYGEIGTLIIENPGVIYRLRVLNNYAGEETPLDSENYPNNMVFEAGEFARIISR